LSRAKSGQSNGIMSDDLLLTPLSEESFDLAKFLTTYVFHQNQFPKLMTDSLMKHMFARKLEPSVKNAMMCVFEGRKQPDILPLFSEIIGAPWKIPRTLPDANNINLLLERNLAHQMDSLPGTEFKDCFLSGDPLTVCAHLYTGLKAMGVRPQFNVGLLRVGDKALPMVWLTIHGTLIDNTYHHWPGMDKEEIKSRLYSAKKIEHYIEEDPTTTKWPLINQLGSRSCVSDPRLLKAFASPEKIGQFLAFRQSQPTFYPNFTLYHRAFVGEPLFRSHAANNREQVINSPVLQDVWNCWFCNKVSKDLEDCPNCTEGLYCDVRCQRADWANHKLLHKDMTANKKFQEEAMRKRLLQP